MNLRRRQALELNKPPRETLTETPLSGLKFWQLGGEILALHFCISECGAEGVGSQVGWRVRMRNGGLPWDCGIAVSALDSMRTQLRSTPYSTTMACLGGM
jgi:hypothetical protein